MWAEATWDRALDAATRSAGAHFRLSLAVTALRLRESLSALGRLDDVDPHGVLARWAEALQATLGRAEASATIQRELVLWEQTAPRARELPIVRMTTALGLPPGARTLVLGAGLVEEDARLGDLFARLQGGARRPLLEVIGRVFGDPRGPDVWEQLAPIVELGLLDPHDRSAPRAEWALAVPRAIWDVLRGDPLAKGSGLEHAPASSSQPIDALVVEPAVAERLERMAPLAKARELRTIVVRGGPGTNTREIAAAAARALGRGLLVTDAREASKHGARLGTIAALLGASPLVAADLAPGESLAVPDVHAAAEPVFVTIGAAGGLRDDASRGTWMISVPPLRRTRRGTVWRRSLGESPLVDELASRFQLSAGHLERLARLTVLEARARGDEPTIDDARRASTLLQREHLDTLAERVDVEGDWQRLVVGEGTWARLRELELRCRQRETILDHLGPGFSGARTRGVRALLSGASGTGKTLASKLLASVLGMDLYRVDLSAVVNKYIGETEKNLHRVLSHAEALDVVLLLDEGDSLLGGRTEVRSANDRYANMETNFLLQRLESYDGILLITTNVQDQIDRAFKRRMDVVVPFVAPGPEERFGIWLLHLPERHDVDPTWLERVARRFPMSGGQIRNAGEHATLLALAEGARVRTEHVEAALKSERQKAGATWPQPEPIHDGAVESFFGALSR